MKVSKVFINTKYSKGKLLGFADISFSLSEGGRGCMLIKGFKLFKDEVGIQVAMPSKEVMVDGERRFYPLIKLDPENEDSKQFMDYLNDKVTVEYKKAKEQQSEEASESVFPNDDGVPF